MMKDPKLEKTIEFCSHLSCSNANSKILTDRLADIARKFKSLPVFPFNKEEFDKFFDCLNVSSLEPATRSQNAFKAPYHSEKDFRIKIHVYTNIIRSADRCSHDYICACTCTSIRFRGMVKDKLLTRLLI